MNIMLLDDEKTALLIMEKMISKIPGIKVIAAFQRVKEAYDFLKKNSVDIAIVDIKVKEESGIDLARWIAAQRPETNIIFLTAYKGFALEAFDVYAADYIVKPASQVRLERTIQKLKLRRKNVYVASSKANYTPGGLFVYCLGGLEIRNIDGEIVDIRSSKSLELFAYLLLCKGKSISKWQIIEDIFQDVHPRTAETHLNTTVYRLRKALEPHGMKTAVITGSGGYRLDIGDVYIDCLDFEERVVKHSTINEDNLKEALKTERIFEGGLFGYKEYIWSLSEKERLLNLYCSFAKKLSEYLLQSDRLDEMLRILQKLLDADELDEETNCLLMRVYAAKKDRMALIRQYQRFGSLLQKELKIVPSNTTVSLYEGLMRSL